MHSLLLLLLSLLLLLLFSFFFFSFFQNSPYSSLACEHGALIVISLWIFFPPSKCFKSKPIFFFFPSQNALCSPSLYVCINACVRMQVSRKKEKGHTQASNSKTEVQYFEICWGKEMQVEIQEGRLISKGESQYGYCKQKSGK